jgi:hypothetical protein
MPADSGAGACDKHHFAMEHATAREEDTGKVPRRVHASNAGAKKEPPGRWMVSPAVRYVYFVTSIFLTVF